MYEEDKIITSIRQGVRVEHFETRRFHKSGRKIPSQYPFLQLKMPSDESLELQK